MSAASGSRDIEHHAPPCELLATPPRQGSSGHFEVRLTAMESTLVDSIVPRLANLEIDRAIDNYMVCKDKGHNEHAEKVQLGKDHHQALLSVRDDIISGIRDLKVTLVEEIQISRNHTAYIPTNAIASPPYQLAAAPILEQIGGTHENMTATRSQLSIATHGTLNSNRTNAGASPPHQLAATPIRDQIGCTHENMIATGSQLSIATHPTNASASPPYQLAASPIPEQIGGARANLTATRSQMSFSLNSNRLKQGRASLARSSVGTEEGSVYRVSSIKSTARVHDEAILENWRQQRLRIGKSRSFGMSHARTTSADIKTYLHKTNAFLNEHNSTPMYYETGFCQQVAQHYLFEHVTLAVVVVNALWMSVDADLSYDESIINAPLPCVIVNVMFYIYYVGEILVRFLAFRHKARFYKDRRFVFDLGLVILYTLDPFVFGIIQYASGKDKAGGLGLSTESLRLFHLLRLFRLTRLLRNLPKLLIIIQGMVSSLSTVGYTFGLLALITYVFAIALRNTVPAQSDIENHYFPTIPDTMHHLLLYGAFLDNLSGFILDVKNDSVACFVLSWLYIVFAHLMIFNVLVGILCESMAMVSCSAEENYVVGKVTDLFFKLLSEYDGSTEGHIGWEEFAELLATSSCQDALKKFDVDVDTLVDMVEDQFFCSDLEGGAITISFMQIIGLIVDLRGTKTASVKDVMVIGRRFNTKFRELKESLDIVEFLIYESMTLG